MRHKIAKKRLGRRKEERTALARNLTRGLFRQAGQDQEFIRTTVTKAKWVKPFAERCITLGVKGYRELQRAADANGTSIAELRAQHTSENKKFTEFPPKVREHWERMVHYRRLIAQRLDDAEAAKQLFEQIAPRYLERPGGYLRVLRTSERRLGDKGDVAILGFVESGEAAAVGAS